MPGNITYETVHQTSVLCSRCQTGDCREIREIWLPWIIWHGQKIRHLLASTLMDVTKHFPYRKVEQDLVSCTERTPMATTMQIKKKGRYLMHLRHSFAKHFSEASEKTNTCWTFTYALDEATMEWQKLTLTEPSQCSIPMCTWFLLVHQKWST